RCYRGDRDGASCASIADCPGGSCAQFLANLPLALNPLTTGVTTLSSTFPGLVCPGQTSAQKGAFLSGICRGGVENGHACEANADCPGSTCRAGSLNNLCDGGANDGSGCATSGDCPGGTCARAGTLV